MGYGLVERLDAMIPRLRKVEFRFPSMTIRGRALEDGRIGRVPAGWHAYSVVDTDGDGFDPVAVDHHGAWVNHRFDFVTTLSLDDRIDEGLFAYTDDWGFVD